MSIAPRTLKPARRGTYRYEANGYDRFDARTNLKDGDMVIIVHPFGCPRPGTMGHYHVADTAGHFIGLVDGRSLTKVTRG